MSRTSGLALSQVELTSLSDRVFGGAGETLTECAAGYSLAVLCETLSTVCEDLVSVVQATPERAFQRQPDDAEGNDVWSVGEVISHLATTTMLAIPFWESVTGSRIDPPGPHALSAVDARRLDKEEAVAAARDITAANLSLAAVLSSNEQLCGRVPHFRLGMIDGPAALLATCLHTADHVHQIEELSDAWKNW